MLVFGGLFLIPLSYLYPLKRPKKKQLEVPVGFAEAHQGQLTKPETATGPSHQGSWALKLHYSWTHATFDGRNQRNVECQCSQCTCCITGAYHLRSLMSSRFILMSCLQSLGTTAFRLTSIDINGSDKTSDMPRGKHLSNVMYMTSLKHERYTTSGRTTSRYHDLAKRKGISEDLQSLKAKHQNGYKSTQ